MKNKAIVRDRFRKEVFERDNHKCKVCGKSGNLDAHHITNRNEMPNGGYVKENGISLCEGEGECHWKAEKVYFDNSSENDFPGFNSEDLYKLINSSYEIAIEKSEKL